METVIRRFAEGDEQAVSDLIVRTLFTSNSRDYPQEELEQIAGRMQPEDITERAKTAHFYVACTPSGEIVGCGAAAPYFGREDECIFLNIFVLPEWQGRGVGRQIVEALEKDAFATRAFRIEIPASITGEAFYLRCGYTWKEGVRVLDGDRLYRLEKHRDRA